jgi:hypothetical protein
MRFTMLLLLTIAAAFSQAPQEPPKQGGGRGPQAPKNLKILKPEDIRNRIMQQYTQALGVNCMHCHVQGDFAADDKPQKNTARMMIAMLNDINAKFPDGAAKAHVSCYTCHNGKVTPLTAPPPATPPAQ